MKLLAKLLMVAVAIWVGMVVVALVLRSGELGKVIKEHPEVYCQNDEDCVLLGVNTCCGMKAVGKKYFDPKENKKTICTMVCPAYQPICRTNICQMQVLNK